MDITLFRAPWEEDRRDSHTLLLQAAARYTGLSPDALGPLDFGRHGKPFFPRQPHLHFSITHSGGWWMCAFAPQPVGLDLQLHHTHLPPADLSRRFFHPTEDAWLAQGGYARFFDLWCAKESWVKFTGHGFFDDPHTFSTVDEEGTFPARPGVQLRLLPAPTGYSLCLCASSIGRVIELEVHE